MDKPCKTNSLNRLEHQTMLDWLKTQSGPTSVWYFISYCIDNYSDTILRSCAMKLVEENNLDGFIISE